MIEYGQIIYLNGTSSAGKTTLARALQDQLPAPYLYVSLEYLHSDVSKAVRRHHPLRSASSPLAREGMLLQHEMRDDRLIMENPLGPVARRFIAGFRQAIRALASTGNNVI